MKKEEMMVQSLANQLGQQAANYAVIVGDRDIQIITLQEENKQLREMLDAQLKGLVDAGTDPVATDRGIRNRGDEVGETRPSRSSLQAVSSDPAATKERASQK